MDKICTKCHKKQNVDQFQPNKKYKDGYAGHCKTCRNKYNKEYRAGKGRVGWLASKRRHNITRYGITVEQYQYLLEEQNYSCAICETVGYSKDEWLNFISGGAEIDRNKLYIDHCHKTNEVRGLLCSECNNGIGKLKDDPELLQRGIYYLKRKGLINV